MISSLDENHFLKILYDLEEKVENLETNKQQNNELIRNLRFSVAECVDKIDKLERKLDIQDAELTKLRNRSLFWDRINRKTVAINLRVFQRLESRKVTDLEDEIEKLGEIFMKLEL